MSKEIEEEIKILELEDGKHRIYRGFWIRLGAVLIDSIVLSLPITLLLSIFYFIPSGMNTEETGLLINLFQAIIVFAITIILWIRWDGATPGKKLLKIKIIDSKTMSDITIGQAILRYVGYFISGIILGIGYIMAGFHSEKKALHDIMAGTLVVKVLD